MSFKNLQDRIVHITPRTKKLVMTNDKNALLKEILHALTVRLLATGHMLQGLGGESDILSQYVAQSKQND